MEQPSSPERAKEIAEQQRSRKMLEDAAEELNKTPSITPEHRERDERWPDNVPVWKPDTQGDLKKVA